MVSIARYMPRFMSDQNRSKITEYKALAPTSDMLRMSEGQYRPIFNRILSSLSIKEVIKNLKMISEREGGKDVVLLCYEKIGDFCHRHMVADWIKDQTGEEVPEYITEAQKKKEQPKITQEKLF